MKPGGLAAGTIASTVDLSNISAIPPDDLDVKYKTLQANDTVASLVKLEGGGPDVKTGAYTVDLFNISAMSPYGLSEKYKVLHARDIVSSLVKLANRRIDEDGRIDNTSAVSSDDPIEKDKALQASGHVSSSVEPQDEGLAAGAYAHAVDLFNISAISPDGPNKMYKALQQVTLSLHW